MFRKSKNNNWLMFSSAMLGGFLLGFSYTKYGKELTERIQNITMPKRRYDFDDDYTTNHEPDA